MRQNGAAFLSSRYFSVSKEVLTFVHLCVGSYRLVELLRKVYSFEGQLGEIGGKANLVDKKYVGGADSDNVTVTIF